MTDDNKPTAPDNKWIDDVLRRAAEAIRTDHPEVSKEIDLEEALKNATEFPTVELVYNDQGTVQNLRIWNGDEFQDLELGKVFIDIEEGKKPHEVTVNGYVHDERHADELEWATKIRLWSREIYEHGNRMLKPYAENRDGLSREKKQEADAIKRWGLTPTIHSFLLTHPDSHPKLARFYRDTIFSWLRQRPELRGHFNVPEKPTYEGTVNPDGLPEYSELTIGGRNAAEQRLNELNDKPSAPPWRSWLPHKVQFLRNEHQEVYALQTVKDGELVDISLHQTIVRAKEMGEDAEGFEWTVHADKKHGVDAARAAICLIQQSLDLLKVYPGSWLKDTEELTHNEFCVLGVVVVCFLLVDHLSHRELGKLYHPNIVKHLKVMPDLRGHLQ